MKREHFNSIPFIDNLIFWAPLTKNGTDIIGEKVPNAIGQNPSYSENGVFLNGGHLNYVIPLDETKAAKTFACTFRFTSLPNPYNYIYSFGSTYNSSFRDATCITSSSSLYKTISYSENRYDKDVNINYPVSQSNEYRIVTVFEDNSQKVYVDGVSVWTNTATDRFNGFGTVDGLLNVGTNPAGTSNRRFYGYVKDFKILDIALAQSEIGLL